MTSTFSFPEIYWIVPVALILGGLCWLFTRKAIAAIFVGIAALPLAWMGHDYLFKAHMESWLSDQRVYAILFKDFPQDKEHFVSEYLSAYKTGGDLGVARKHEEMKIIMQEHHLGHYIENAPSNLINQYIVAETWFLSAITTKDKKACERYFANTSSFEDVWRAVGSDIYLASLRYYPLMIVGAVDTPEVPSPSERIKAAQLTIQLTKKLEAAGALGLNENLTGITSCDTVYRQYYMLSQMPPKDGALVLKYIMSENHLKDSGAPAIGVLKMLLPF